MNVREQIDSYIADQSAAKSEELRDLHRRILEISPDAKLWFLDGRNDEGKVVSNPNIGYGSVTLDYASGESRAFYKLGLSANTVAVHRANIMQTLGIHNTAELVVYAIRQGLVSIA